MRSEKSRKLRSNEKVPGGTDFAKTVINLAIVVTGKDGRRYRLTRKEKTVQEIEVYRRHRAKQARAERTLRRQCEELLQRCQERMR